MPGRGEYWKVSGTNKSGVAFAQLDEDLQAQVTGPGSGAHIIQNQGSSLPFQPKLNFVGPGVVASDGTGETIVTIPGGGHTVEDEGSGVTDRPILNFVGAGVTASDDGEKTVVTIPFSANSTDNLNNKTIDGGNNTLEELNWSVIMRAEAGGTIPMWDDGGDPVKLPIGTTGQILSVNSAGEQAEWKDGPADPATFFLNNAVLQEEFISADPDFFTDQHYQGVGTFTMGASPDDLHGVVTMAVASAIAGNASSLASSPYGSGGFQVELDRDLDFIQIITDFAGNQGLANTMGFFCINNKNPGNGPTDKDAWLAFSNIRAIGFYVDPGEDGFFHIFSSDGTTITEAVTTVAVADFTRFKLSFHYDFATTTATFFINGVSVGTISTNIPASELAMYSAVYNVNAVQTEMSLDAWFLSNPRP